MASLPISMQPEAQPPGVSNYERPVALGNPASYKFYETIYTLAGPQEWIKMPGIGLWGGPAASVTVSFPLGVGSCILEGTDSPNCVIDGTVTPKGYAGPVTYLVPGHPFDNNGAPSPITDITHFLIQGPTAIRINLAGGSAMISVRV